MPGPGKKAATEATLRMPPLWRSRLSMNASERSVSARTLRSIMRNCSARSSVAALPSSPKPALLTTMSGSTPSMTITSPMRSTASASSRSTGRNSGLRWPLAAIASASSASFCSRRAMSKSSWPCRANSWASAVPMPADAPVISVTGRISGLAGPAIGGHVMTQLDPVARGNAEQVRGPPEQVVLELGDAAVGVDHFPHHLDHAPPAVLIERPVDQAGEVIEIDCLVLGLGGVEDQLVGRRFIEAEPPLDDGVQLVALDVRHGAVDHDRVHQERGSGETIVVGLEAARMLAALGDIGQEFSKNLEHDAIAMGIFTASACTSLPRSPAGFG